jgi:hypothetical protein
LTEDEINKELIHDIAMRKSTGYKTQQMLNKMGVVSPEFKNRVKIAQGFWIIPKQPFSNEEEKTEYINNMRIRFKGKYV